MDGCMGHTALLASCTDAPLISEDKRHLDICNIELVEEDADALSRLRLEIYELLCQFPYDSGRYVSHQERAPRNGLNWSVDDDS